MPYLTKEQVVADFQLSFMPKLKGRSEYDVEMFWKANLNFLAEEKRITKKMEETWIFPKKDLDIK